MTVTTTQPQRSSLAQTLPANGNITAWQEAIIGSESSGLRLNEVKAQVGDTVRKGQLLATFAADTIQADVAQARAVLLEAEASANAERARTHLRVLRQIHKHNGVAGLRINRGRDHPCAAF